MLNFIRKGRITPGELKIIRAEVETYKDKAFVSTLTGKTKLNLDFRDSLVYFPKPKEAPKTFNILQSLIAMEYVGSLLDVTDKAEIQYVRYPIGGVFKWHQDDVDINSTKGRGITFSLNISEEDSYTGGELLVKTNNESVEKLEKPAGSYIAFPSFLKHTATEVLSGTREAVVVWIHLTAKEREYLRSLKNF